MYYLAYEKIKQFFDGPFGGVEIACFTVEDDVICINKSSVLFTFLSEKYKDYHVETHKLKKDVYTNSYYYLNYLNYDKIKDSTEGNVKVFCYFNGQTWMCVSEKNTKVVDQLEAWYNSTHNVTFLTVTITEEMEKDFQNYK